MRKKAGKHYSLLTCNIADISLAPTYFVALCGKLALFTARLSYCLQLLCLALAPFPMGTRLFPYIDTAVFTKKKEDWSKHQILWKNCLEEGGLSSTLSFCPQRQGVKIRTKIEALFWFLISDSCAILVHHPSSNVLFTSGTIYVAFWFLLISSGQ